MRRIITFFEWLLGGFAFIIIISIFKAGFEEEGTVPIAIPETPAYYEALGEFGGTAGAFIIALLCLLACFFLIVVKRRLSMKKKDSTPVSIHAPFVLYLRSFIDDATTRRNLSWISGEKTEEEELVDVLSDIADVYAIGNPEDKRMPLGASRVYVDNMHWKEVVGDLASKAELVALRLGKTDGVWWEVEKVLEDVPRQKLLFIIPTSPDDSRIKRLRGLMSYYGIDISSLDISYGKTLRGSISSFLYFDEKGLPHSSNLSIPRFTRFFYSYSSAIRVALKEFRSGYGLSPFKGLSVNRSRVLQILLPLFLILIFGMLYYGKYLALKYQRPYELAEQCVCDESFALHHGSEVNGSTLLWGIVDSMKGLPALSDDRFASIMLIEAETMSRVDQYEFHQLLAEPYHMLLMTKKYCPELYPEYVDIMAEAALLYNNDKEGVKEISEHYRSLSPAFPSWLLEQWEALEEGDIECFYEYYKTAISHLDEPETVTYLKIICSFGLE